MAGPVGGFELRHRPPRGSLVAAEAHRIRLAFQYDPHFAVSVSQVDPLPHQMDAVYSHLLTQPQIRFLIADDPGAGLTHDGFAAQLGFRVPNIVISPFTRKHYVSHLPMDHTAIIKFVENRFLGSTVHLTNRDAAQPNLLDFFDFTNVPWATPPSPPVPNQPPGQCTADSM